MNTDQRCAAAGFSYPDIPDNRRPTRASRLSRNGFEPFGNPEELPQPSENKLSGISG
jgi:hypothetical protein